MSALLSLRPSPNAGYIADKGQQAPCFKSDEATDLITHLGANWLDTPDVFDEIASRTSGMFELYSGDYDYNFYNGIELSVKYGGSWVLLNLIYTEATNGQASEGFGKWLRGFMRSGISIDDAIPYFRFGIISTKLISEGMSQDIDPSVLSFLRTAS